MVRPIVGKLESFIKPLLCFLEKVVHLGGKIFIPCKDVAAAWDVEAVARLRWVRAELKLTFLLGLDPDAARTRPDAPRGVDEVGWLIAGWAVRGAIGVGRAHG